MFPTLPEVVRLKCTMYIFKSCSVKRIVLLQLLVCKSGHCVTKTQYLVVSSSVLQEWVKKLHIIINVFISISFGSDFAEYVSILVNIDALNDIFSCWDLLISYWTIQEPHACKSEWFCCSESIEWCLSAGVEHAGWRRGPNKLVSSCNAWCFCLPG